MNRETEIALKNYDWLIRRDGLDEIGLHWESGTLILRNGGANIESLCEEGSTPATSWF